MHWRIYGPSPERGGRRFRVIIVTGRGSARKRESSYFATTRDAERFIRAARKELEAASLSVMEAIDRWRDWMKARGLRPSSYETAVARMESLVGGRDMAMGDLTPKRAEALFEAFSARPIMRSGKRLEALPSTDHRMNVLLEARRFARWAMKGEIWHSDPFAGLEVLGRRKRGKKKLRVDEARKLAAVAHAEGGPAAVAALLALYLGMRASEIMGLTVRDLDDGGRLLWIDDSKTDSGRRTLEVPDPLRPMLLALAEDRDSGEPLIIDRHRDWLTRNVRRLCAVADVPTVTPHGLRGTHATLARDAGATGHLVAGALGHASEAVTEAHYLEPGTAQRGTARRVFEVIDGGNCPAAVPRRDAS